MQKKITFSMLVCGFILAACSSGGSSGDPTAPATVQAASISASGTDGSGQPRNLTITGAVTPTITVE